MRVESLNAWTGVSIGRDEPGGADGPIGRVSTVIHAARREMAVERRLQRDFVSLGKKERTKGAGVALVALAALFWGLSGGIGGILMASGWDPFVVSFYRGAIGLGCALIWLALRPGGHGLRNRRLWFWSALAGLGVAGNFAFYFMSISEGSVAVAATLMYCAPVFVYLVSFALKMEKPTMLKWVSIAVTLLGVLLLTRILEVGAGGITAVAVGAGLLSGLSYALFIFGFKYAAEYGSPQSILVVSFTALIAMLAWAGDRDQMVSVLSAPSWPLFAALGVFGAGLSFILYIIGLKHTAPAVASIVAMVEPVTAALFGYFVLDQGLVGSQILGMALILSTVTAMSARSSGGQVSPELEVS